jgi:hypothetical protein
VDYLLFQLNFRKCFHYLKLFDLKEPIDEVDLLLDEICKFKKRDEREEENRFYASNLLISLFRQGKLGNLILDSFDE